MAQLNSGNVIFCPFINSPRGIVVTHENGKVVDYDCDYKVCNQTCDLTKHQPINK